MAMNITDPEFWAKVKKFASKVPFATDAVAMFYAMRDRKTPTKDRLFIYAALIYWLLPFDLIPDFLAGLGQLDDFGAISLALMSVRKSVTPAHRAKAKAVLGLAKTNEE
ncbi:MAG: hypothetical protein RLZZ508_9 [Actinomycetota bacterium]|jgi:uncharacterized membrane protein YkvA (DUF1232 family)